MAAKMRSIRAHDEQWDEITARAEAAGESIAAYIIRRSLEPDRVGGLLGALKSIRDSASSAIKRHRSGSSD